MLEESIFKTYALYCDECFAWEDHHFPVNEKITLKLKNQFKNNFIHEKFCSKYKEKFINSWNSVLKQFKIDKEQQFSVNNII